MNTSSLRSLPLAFFGLTLSAGGAGCGLLLGLDEFSEGTGSGGGGAATSSSTGGTGSSTGGAGDTGGNPTPCTPKETRPCYGGPAGTEGNGVCKKGTQTCNVDGTGFDACVGEVVPAPENCALPQDEDCSGTAAQCTGTAQWGRRFWNGTGNQGVSGVALDSKGNTIISGALGGAVDFGKGDVMGAAYLTKLDPSGTAVFSKALPSPGFMVVDSSDNITLVGYFVGDIDFGGGPLDKPGADNIFLAKLAPDGSHKLSKTIGYGSFTLYDMAAGPDESIFIAGLALGAVDLGGGLFGAAKKYSAFVAKYDKTGSHVYSLHFGSVGSLGGAQAQAITVDGLGNAVVAAGFYGTVDVNGLSFDTSKGTLLVARIDPAGKFLHVKQFSGADAGLVDGSMSVVMPGNYDIAADAAGNVLLTGDFNATATFGGPALMNQGGSDIYVAKLDPMGGHLWSKSFGGAGKQYATHIAVDMFGHPVITGVFEGNFNIPNAVTLYGGAGDNVLGLKLDASGGYLWAVGSSSGPVSSKGTTTNVAIGLLGEVALSGAVKDNFKFGMVPSQTGGFFDAYVAKLAP